MPGTLEQPQRRRDLLRGGAGVVAALAAGCNESPATALAAWRGPAANIVDPRLVALSWALLAPSPHNSQPWLTHLNDSDGIAVRIDPRRLLPIVDPQVRQGLISLGAFLELLALAAAAQGLRATIGLGPSGGADVRLRPGAVSSLRHAHSHQDELVFILEGEPTLVTDAGETVLQPGMAAGFKAGLMDAHHLVNRTDRTVVYLEIGDRAARDRVHYPDDDIVAALGTDGGWRFVHKNGQRY